MSRGRFRRRYDDDPLRDHRFHVFTGDAGVQVVDTGARHPLSVRERFLDRACRLLDVGDYATPQPGRPGLPHAQHLDARDCSCQQLAMMAGLRGTDVESTDETFWIHESRAITGHESKSSSRGMTGASRVQLDRRYLQPFDADVGPTHGNVMIASFD
jgi:hypothetical protein